MMPDDARCSPANPRGTAGIGAVPLLQAWPNPARQTVMLDLTGDHQVEWQMRLIDLNGRIIDQRTWPVGLQAYPLPASVKPGTYLLEAYSDRGQRARVRLVVLP